MASKAKAYRMAHHSKPGEPPFVQTGHLRRSITWRNNGRLRAWVGVNVGNAEVSGYALALEFGTKNMAARPFLRSTMWRNVDALRSIMLTPVMV